MNIKNIKNSISNTIKIKRASRWLLGRKISLSFAIIILIFITIIVVQILGFQNLNSIIQVNNDKFSNAIYIKEAEKTFSLFQISLLESQSYTEDYYKNLDNTFDEFKSSLAGGVEKVVKNSDNFQIIKVGDTLKESIEEYFILSKDYIRLRKGKNTAEFGKTDLEKNLIGSYIYNQMATINNALTEEYKEKAKEAMDSSAFILRIAIISVIIGTVLGAMLALILTLRINNGIKNLLGNILTSINYIVLCVSAKNSLFFIFLAGFFLLISSF